MKNIGRLQIHPAKKVRLIIVSDTNCEGDDQFALAHALLSDKIEVTGIIAEHYGNIEADSMIRSYQEAQKILMLMDKKKVPLIQGSVCALTGPDITADCKGAEFIVRECRREDERPLFIIAQGPLTSIAAALLMDDIVAEKALCICIGGCRYPEGGFEFNFQNDLYAAELVMKSSMEVWMIPEEVYSTMQAGLYELYEKVHPYGEIGKYLADHLLEIQKEMTYRLLKVSRGSRHERALSFPNGESWSLGDSCGIGLLISANAGKYQMVTAPLIRQDGTYECMENRKMIRLYESIDSRLILEDFYAKLRYFYG